MINKIKSFAKLEDNWDGYGGKKIGPKTIALSINVFKMLQSYNIKPDIVPTTNGNILFECIFNIEGGNDFSFEVNEKEEILFEEEDHSEIIDLGEIELIGEYVRKHYDK